MRLLDRLYRRKREDRTVGKPAPYSFQPGMVVEVGNRLTGDNWLTNEADIPVTVACKEMFGSFTIHFRPGESKRITTNVHAAPFPYGEYNYDHLDNSIERCSEWTVRREEGNLVLVKVRTWPEPSDKSWEPPRRARGRLTCVRRT
jgi:hypothetical protein